MCAQGDRKAAGRPQVVVLQSLFVQTHASQHFVTPTDWLPDYDRCDTDTVVKLKHEISKLLMQLIHFQRSGLFLTGVHLFFYPVTLFFSSHPDEQTC